MSWFKRLFSVQASPPQDPASPDIADTLPPQNLPPIETVPEPPENPFDISHSAAKYGKSFSTLEYSLNRDGVKVTSHLQALAPRAPEAWSVQQVTVFKTDDPAKQAEFPDHVQTLLTDVPLWQALREARLFERDMPEKGYVLPPPEAEDAMGFEHHEAFGIREGIVFDQDLEPHAIVDGKIISDGRFRPGLIDKMKTIFEKISHNPDLLKQEAWSDQVMQQVVTPLAEPLTVEDLRRHRTSLQALDNVIFNLKNTLQFHKFMERHNYDSSKIDYEEFSKTVDTKTHQLGWPKDVFLNPGNTAQLYQRTFGQTLQAIQALDLPDSKKREITSFACAARIAFHLGWGRALKTQQIEALSQGTLDNNAFGQFHRNVAMIVDTCAQSAEMMNLRDNSFKARIENALLATPRQLIDPAFDKYFAHLVDIRELTAGGFKSVLTGEGLKADFAKARQTIALAPPANDILPAGNELPRRQCLPGPESL